MALTLERSAQGRGEIERTLLAHEQLHLGELTDLLVERLRIREAFPGLLDAGFRAAALGDDCMQARPCRRLARGQIPHNHRTQWRRTTAALLLEALTSGALVADDLEQKRELARAVGSVRKVVGVLPRDRGAIEQKQCRVGGVVDLVERGQPAGE